MNVRLRINEPKRGLTIWLSVCDDLLFVAQERESGEQASAASQNSQSHASASFYDPDMSKCSDASSVFDVSLDGDSCCKGQEVDSAPRKHQASSDVIRESGCQEGQAHFQVRTLPCAAQHRRPCLIFYVTLAKVCTGTSAVVAAGGPDV